MCDDPSPAARREAAILLRGLPLEEARPSLLKLAARCDGEDRFYLEALGLACEAHAEALYPELRERLGGPPGEWSPAFAALVWRLHPQAAVDDLRLHCQTRRLAAAERRRMIDALAFTGGERARQALADLATALRAELARAEDSQALAEYAEWWTASLAKAASLPAADPAAPPLRLSPTLDRPATRSVDRARMETILRLEGDAERGRRLFFSAQTACAHCHRFGAEGGLLGPDLTEIGRRLSQAQLVEAVLEPSAAILAGYETWTIVDVQGRSYTGMVVSLGEAIVLRSAAGDSPPIPRRQVEEFRRQETSLMPQFTPGALPDQDAADLAAFLSRGP
jgi:putative heme-binding domain-containing protein